MKYLSKFFFFLFTLILFNNCYSKNNTINNIRTSDKFNNNITRIVLDLSKKTAYSVFILDNNPRLVIDLEATENKEFYDLKSQLIEKLRINNNNAKGVIRLVFDLKEKAYIACFGVYSALHV